MKTNITLAAILAVLLVILGLSWFARRDDTRPPQMSQAEAKRVIGILNGMKAKPCSLEIAEAGYACASIHDETVYYFK
ncbi:MAG: hypothetical protein WC373_16580 [Smithella sp.]|jgi:membrane protein implicated in regulation of membrane protease activity